MLAKKHSSDVKLIENNAHVGAQVACELAKLERELSNAHASSATYYTSPSTQSTASTLVSASSVGSKADSPLPTPDVLVFGSAAIDITSSSSLPISPRSTTPGTIFVSPGGVGRNIAEAAQNLLPPDTIQLVSLIGRQAGSSDVKEPDALGKLLTIELERSRLRTDGLALGSIEGVITAGCSLTLDRDGDLLNGVADMNVVEGLTGEMVRYPVSVRYIELNEIRSPRRLSGIALR